MSDDLVKKADAFLSHMAHEMQDICDYCQRDKAEELVQELVAEVKRLREDNQFLHKFVDAPGSILEAALNEARLIMDAIEKQQTAFVDAIETAGKTLDGKDAEISAWAKRHAYATDMVAKCDALYRETCAKNDVEIARWQQIAIEERAKVLAWERVEKDAPHWTDMTEQAAKELNNIWLSKQ